jgi:hypothetical protein
VSVQAVGGGRTERKAQPRTARTATVRQAATSPGTSGWEPAGLAPLLIQIEPLEMTLTKLGEGAVTRRNDRRRTDRRQGGRPGGRRAEDAWPEPARAYTRSPEHRAGVVLWEARQVETWAREYVRDAIGEARAAGATWALIGGAFGLTAEGARRRWTVPPAHTSAPVVDP